MKPKGDRIIQSIRIIQGRLGCLVVNKFTQESQWINKRGVFPPSIHSVGVGRWRRIRSM